MSRPEGQRVSGHAPHLVVAEARGVALGVGLAEFPAAVVIGVGGLLQQGVGDLGQPSKGVVLEGRRVSVGVGLAGDPSKGVVFDLFEGAVRVGGPCPAVVLVVVVGDGDPVRVGDGLQVARGVQAVERLLLKGVSHLYLPPCLVVLVLCSISVGIHLSR